MKRAGAAHVETRGPQAAGSPALHGSPSSFRAQRVGERTKLRALHRLWGARSRGVVVHPCTMRGALRRTASADHLTVAASAPAAMAPAPAVASLRQQRRLHLGLRFHGYRLGLSVPNEMWGATALALRLAQPPGASGLPPLPRTASVIAQAFSAAAAVPPPAGPVSEDHPKALAEALEWRPQLGAAEDWACLLGPALVCAVVYALTAPAKVQPVYGACMALLYAVLIAVTRTWLLERRYQAVQRSERELAAVDSHFFPLDGIQLHYKRRTPAIALGMGGGGSLGALGGSKEEQRGQGQGRPDAVIHCLHGFGASCYSWSFVQQELADGLHAVVTAHDMPGFGLTERPRSPSYYTLHFNGDAARAIMDAEVAGQLAAQQAQQGGQQSQQAAQQAAASRQPGAAEESAGGGDWRSHPLSSASSSASLADSEQAEADSSDGASQQQAQQAAQQAQQAQQAQRPPKRVLIGHSMGGAAAAEGLISQPEGVDALVLVAPAIVALWLGPPEEAAGDAVATGLAVVEELVSAEDAPGELSRLSSSASFSRTASSASSSANSFGSANSSGSPSLSRSQSASNEGGSANGSGGAAGGSRAGSRGGGGPGSRARRAVRSAAAVAKAVWMLVVRSVLTAATPLLVLLLRRLVRARRFWERGLASAWHDSGRVTREYVDAYRSGQLVRGWEGGILRFLSARFAEKHGFWESLREAVQGKGHLTQAERLASAIRRHNIRVLIIHGGSDALVPAANSRRLAALLPNTELVVFEGCGHMPQEECPERFVETVRSFVNTLG